MVKGGHSLRVAGLAALLAAACAEPPGVSSEGGAPLREALSSSPEEILALPLERRMALATRFDAAVRTQRERGLLAAAEAAEAAEAIDAPDLVEAHDLGRAQRGADALVALAIEPVGLDAQLLTLAMMDADGAVPEAAPALAFEDPAFAQEPLASGLRGRAREVIEQLAARTGARTVRLAPRMPAALAARGERLFVNPVWLVLEAELDEHARAGELGASSSPLIGSSGPFDHHRETSTGWGCYQSCTCDCTTWRCNYCGWDCGECACECGPDGRGVHCAAAEHEHARPAGAPLDPLWLLVPVAYLAWRRRRG
ncbi:MAG: hypothetical protein KF729_32315 [Sandaracinaceae bacterium]|nr:hypothetical protein [Sandaracinaceae bacterium]